MSTILPINIDDLLHFRGVESSRVEFKKSWNEGPTGQQILRTICAFANDLQNLNGGYVILGVEEEHGLAKLPPAGLSPEEIAKAQTWIRGRCNTLDPVYQPIFSPEVVEGKHILVVWAPGSDTRPHQAPEGSEKTGRKYFARIGNETVEAKGAILTQLIQLTAKVPFDDRRALGVPVEKIREAKVREFLADIHSGLLDEPDAREIYRRMQISSRVNGHDAPRNIGLLLFSDDPEEWFRGAHVEVVQFADDASGNVIEERVFRGPLQQQIRDALAYLRTFSARHLEKLGDRPEVRDWVSFPFPAIEESLVNALYHRSYEGEPEPTKAYLYSDRLEVISYPGPVPGIEARHLQPGAMIPPVPARNRRIGELLKELRLAEGRGTGIPKIFRAMQQNGSPPPRFDFDDARTYFRVTLPAHPEYLTISALRDAAHLRALGDESGGRQRLRRALNEQPGSGTLAAALIEDFARTGDLDAARRTLDLLMSTTHTDHVSRAITALSKAYFNADRIQEAKAILDQLPRGED
jgi:ATP-dependent DNA helicase RecG